MPFRFCPISLSLPSFVFFFPPHFGCPFLEFFSLSLHFSVFSVFFFSQYRSLFPHFPVFFFSLSLPFSAFSVFVFFLSLSLCFSAFSVVWRRARSEGNLPPLKKWPRLARPTARSATTAWTARCSCRASTSSAASASRSGECGFLERPFPPPTAFFFFFLPKT